MGALGAFQNSTGMPSPKATKQHQKVFFLWHVLVLSLCVVFVITLFCPTVLLWAWWGRKISLSVNTPQATCCHSRLLRVSLFPENKSIESLRFQAMLHICGWPHPPKHSIFSRFWMQPLERWTAVTQNVNLPCKVLWGSGFPGCWKRIILQQKHFCKALLLSLRHCQQKERLLHVPGKNSGMMNQVLWHVLTS